MSGAKQFVTVELIDREGYPLGRVVSPWPEGADFQTAARQAVQDVLAGMTKPWLPCEVTDRQGTFSPGAVRPERIFTVRAAS